MKVVGHPFCDQTGKHKTKASGYFGLEGSQLPFRRPKQAIENPHSAGAEWGSTKIIQKTECSYHYNTITIMVITKSQPFQRNRI